MTVARSEIERGLDDLVSFESGFKFQSLAVILAKKRWPELIASERKWDHGLDAYAHPELGLATSITPKLGKIKDDAKRVRASFPHLKTLVFYTPESVTNHTGQQWAEELKKEFDLDLIVVSREDVITSLMEPANAPLCQSHLGIAVPVAEAARDTLAAAMAACGETVAGWLSQYQLSQHPLIGLDLVRVADQQQHHALDLGELDEEVRRGRRVVLEGPPGAGKTTTLLQLGRKLVHAGHLCLVIDLPGWIESGQDPLTYQAESLAFRSRGVSAQDLAALIAAQPIAMLLNGWNEIGEAHAAAAAQRLRRLDRDYAGAGILLATRAHTLAPPLAGAWRISVQPLRGEQRRAFLSQVLGGRARELLDQIARRPTLDALTRTPLILSEVAKLFQAGEPIPEAKLDILRAMTERIERSEEHQAALATPPISGLASAYLEALAVEMMTHGTIDVAEPTARAVVARKAGALRDAGQLAAPPEPQAVLTGLCAHHILLRLDHPTATVRFQHQQFQEFYAGLHLLEMLRSLLSSADEPAARDFQRTYLNRPAWEEVLAMVAEAVGTGSPTVGAPAHATSLGVSLVRWSIPVDPILAAALARRAGAEVWKQVGSELGTLLRRWYASGDPHHRHCALAAMLATGAEDFVDVVLPLLTNANQQVRLGTYRAVNNFHPSSLGSNWREVVAGWGEEQRADFVGEVLSRPRFTALAENFATTDPSSRVRRAAIHALQWVDARDALARVLDTLDGSDLVEATSRAEETQALSETASARLKAALWSRADEAGDPVGRLRLLRRLVELGDPAAADRLRTALESLSEADLRAADRWVLLDVVKDIRASGARWTDVWITERVARGLLWPEDWMSYVNEVPPALAEQLLEQIGQGELDPNRLRGAFAVLSRAADEEIAARIWQRLIEIHPPSETEAKGRHDPLRSALRRQLEDAVRNLPAPLRVSAALQLLSSPPRAEQSCALIEVFGRASEEETLRAELPDALARSLHDALVALIPFVLGEDDFGGGLKAQLALAIASVGGPDDAANIRQLIDADIERRRSGIEVLRRGERNAQTNGASMSWSNWYVRALCWLGKEAAEPHLLDLLKQSGYEDDAARALARLVIELRPLEEQFRARLIEPGSDPPRVTDEPRWARFAATVRNHVQHLFGALNGAENAARPAAPTKSLARTLAWLDGRDSRDLVLRVMALPGEWDGWTRTEALEQLLRVHRRLPAEATFAALNPTVEHMLRQGVFDDQNRHLLKRCLFLLALVDDPERGIARIREVLAAARLHAHELRDLVLPLARNGSEQALDLLIELASAAGDGFRTFGKEWIAAVAGMALPRARTVLMASVDPRLSPIVAGLNRFQEEVGEQLAQLARSDPAMLEQLREVCALSVSPAQRLTLCHVAALLADEMAIAVLDLIRDGSTPPVPFPLVQAIETVVLGREPYRGLPSAYSLVPRSAGDLRSRLFAMVHRDPTRRRAAFSLLGRIDEWRLEHGRPLDEPRHPDLASGLAWPPLDPVDSDQNSLSAVHP